jgi:hypothetical protein
MVQRFGFNEMKGSSKIKNQKGREKANKIAFFKAGGCVGARRWRGARRIPRERRRVCVPPTARL